MSRSRFVSAAILAVTAGAALLAALALGAEPAWAHGGRFIPPPPPIGPPPGLGVPPIPPPVTPPPGVPSPVTPPTTPVPPVTTPGTPPGLAPGGFAGSRGGRRTPVVRDPNAAWQTWWNLNRMAYLPDRDAVRDRTVLTPRADDDPRFWRTQRAERAATEVVPFLLELIDPATRARDDVVASALLALGRTAREPDVADLLLTRLRDPKAPVLVRESAALAAGLLRRTDAELQFDGAVFDRVRDALLDAAGDPAVPVRTRAFAVLSVGLLGDQPYGSPYSQDGRLVVRTLWSRLGDKYAHRDIPIAILHAIGRQPPRGVPSAVREALRMMVSGRRVHGRRWDSIERGHALAAAMRLGGPASHALLLRVLARPREHRDVKRSGYVSLGFVAPRLAAAGRLETARAVLTARQRDRDPLTQGLGDLALAHLLAADLAAGSDPVLLGTPAARELLSAAKGGSSASRGFSFLALGVAAQQATSPSRSVSSFRADAAQLLVAALGRKSLNEDLKAAAAVALGLMESGEARDPLRAVVEDRSAGAAFRGHAAVALAQIGPPSPAIERAINLALADPRDLELRRQAALALALLGGNRAATPLLRELKTGRTELMMAQVVVALGRLGQLRAIGPLKEVAANERLGELARSLAVVALGLLTDPESRPSLLRLTAHSFYPARTESLDEAFTIL